ncbi:hypothetical protein [Thermogemmatispora carboxidivorans]|uniref:hypothetical protein n=1 Tax=Thermogemmatispora carboxidivorans TaxID=1382306 RepID=UPI0012DDB171|nr:hypothetical protein [Thermogemmatispora carboxidivorans]
MTELAGWLAMESRAIAHPGPTVSPSIRAAMTQGLPLLLEPGKKAVSAGLIR